MPPALFTCMNTHIHRPCTELMAKEEKELFQVRERE